MRSLRRVSVAAQGLRRGWGCRSRPLFFLRAATFMYTVKEIFYTLQGEGANAGRAAVFCRFAGCNLWTGREEDRASAVCTFCDTDFVGVGPDGGKFATAHDLAEAIASRWPSADASPGTRFVVC